MAATATIAPPNLKGASALTLRPPWDLAVTTCGKTIENRTWLVSGTPRTLLIHRGMKDDRDAYSFIERIGHIITRKKRPAGIVAVATLTGVCGRSAGFYSVVCDCGPWAAAGQMHWRLANVITLDEVVPCSGHQGLWIPKPADLAAVAEQVGA